MNTSSSTPPPPSAGKPGRKIFGRDPMKVLFAMEYVMQGLANPFQGITYQSFFNHFRKHYGLTEAATQQMFSKSYLAWAFKPVIGFLMDAYGKTRVVLTFLLAAGAAFYFLTPLIDRGAMVFFWSMFALSVLFACTDVAVDRATVVEGDEEARSSGRSKAAVVGLNQAICWAAIYGTGVFSAAAGGWLADHVRIRYLLYALGVVPLVVLWVVRRLPGDSAHTVPVRRSVSAFWTGLNSGPVLWVVLFYFLFHFSPQMGALWVNYLIETVKFTQTQIGYADSLAYAGYFIGVLLFARFGVRWQDRFGLRAVFRVAIVASVLLSFTQYLILEPRFSRICVWLHRWLPGVDMGALRWGYYAGYGFLTAIVNVVHPHEHLQPGRGDHSGGGGGLAVRGLHVGLQPGLFLLLRRAGVAVRAGNAGGPASLDGARAVRRFLRAGDKMSYELLVFLGSVAGLLSLVVVRALPDRRHTAAGGDHEPAGLGPEDHRRLGPDRLRAVNGTAWVLFAGLLWGQWQVAGLEPIASVILSFFTAAFIRKVALDRMCRRQNRRPAS
ncbi:MAG: hypothetical protein U1F77_18975 [Kiritimatiellia bacterium]